jgi:protein-tyrosine kinase
MSRIHEALKKAELEKAGNTTATADTQIPARPAPMPQTRTAVAEPPTQGQLAFESLAAGCRKSHWHGDPKKLFMLNPNQHGYGAEQLRTLRSRLYQLRDRMPLQTLLVTSALPGEGKTFVTANLAHAFVRQHERRILLIDTDLRRSHLHEILGAPNEPGLSDYLRGEADLNSVVQRGALNNLFFISGGKTAENPAELLASEKLKQLIDRMTPLFDWVILDSPPVIPVSDPSLLADLCHGVLLVVRSGSTHLDAILKVGQEMREKRLVGVVLNCMEEHNSASPGYYGYYGYSSDSADAKPGIHGG